MITRIALCSKGTIALLLALSAIALVGCSSYTTPGPGVSMASLAHADADIRDRMSREPAAAFPARVAVVRAQGPGYRSYSYDGCGKGNFSVVTQRDTETEKDFDRLGRLPMVAALAAVNRLILPPNLASDRELRAAAASLKADILLVYSFDTVFRVNDTDIGPLGLITLGYLPINEAIVTSTASAALFDVRTGYVYGLAESTAVEKQLASAWSSRSAADACRVKAERKAFEGLLTELEKTWKGVVETYAGKTQASR